MISRGGIELRRIWEIACSTWRLNMDNSAFHLLGCLTILRTKTNPDESVLASRLFVSQSARNVIIVPLVWMYNFCTLRPVLESDTVIDPSSAPQKMMSAERWHAMANMETTSSASVIWTRLGALDSVLLFSSSVSFPIGMVIPHTLHWGPRMSIKYRLSLLKTILLKPTSSDLIRCIIFRVLNSKSWMVPKPSSLVSVRPSGLLARVWVLTHCFDGIKQSQTSILVRSSKQL